MQTNEDSAFLKHTWSRRSLLGMLAFGAVTRAESEPLTAKSRAPRLVLAWEHGNLTQQSESHGIFHLAGHLYVGTGTKQMETDPRYGRICKVRVRDGVLAWSFVTGNSYQPSYPVSNGKVVVFGTYYDHTLTGISDDTGALLWKIPTRDQNHAAACFAENRVFIPSYDGRIYAIEWSSGKVLWMTGLHGAAWATTWSTPAIWKDRILVGCNDGFLYSLDQATGRIMGKTDCGGAVDSNPLVVGKLAFVSANEFTDQPGKGLGREGKTMLVVDPAAGKVIERFTAQPHGFVRNPVAAGQQVFFADERTLYAYNVERRALDWKTEKLPAVFPYPVVVNKQVLLPMNPGPNDVSPRHATRCVVLDRDTGALLAESESGGVVGISREPHYAWTGDRLILADRHLAAYRLEMPLGA